jgi:predicted nucleic acid-binding protein
VVRILSYPKYPNSAGSPAAICPILATLRALPGHHFWPDSISLVGCDIIDATQITTPGEVTDAYLLALAITHGGQLATFDRRLATRSVHRGKAGLHVIEGTG